MFLLLPGIPCCHHCPVAQALWGRAGAGMAADIVAAVEDAIKDGVDVINYSASTTSDSFRDPITSAFMNAGEC